MIGAACLSTKSACYYNEEVCSNNIKEFIFAVFGKHPQDLKIVCCADIMFLKFTLDINHIDPFVSLSVVY